MLQNLLPGKHAKNWVANILGLLFRHKGIEPVWALEAGEQVRVGSVLRLETSKELL